MIPYFEDMIHNIIIELAMDRGIIVIQITIFSILNFNTEKLEKRTFSFWSHNMYAIKKIKATPSAILLAKTRTCNTHFWEAPLTIDQ